MHPAHSSGAASSSATAGGGTPASADLVAQLNKKVELQRRELDERTDSVNAIQRNFQRLSEMYAGDRAKIEALEEELKKAKAELDALRAEKRVHAALRQEFNALQAELATLKKASDGQSSEHAAALERAEREVLELRQQVAMLQRNVADAAAAASEATDLRATLVPAAESLEAASARLFAGVKEVQAEAGLVAPLLGAGLTALSKDVGRMDPLDRFAVATKAVDFCAANAFAPITRTIDELKSRHDGALADLRAQHEESLAAARREADDAKALAAQQAQLAAENAAKLKEAGRVFNLERQSLAGKADSSKAAADSLLSQLRADLDAANAARDAAEARVAERDEEIAALRGSLASAQADHAALKDAMREAAKAAEAASDALRAELDALRGRCASLESTVDATRTEAQRQQKLAESRQARIVELEGAIADLRRDAAAERERLAQGAANNASASEAKWRADVESLRTELATLKNVLSAERDGRAADAAAAKAHAIGLERDLERTQHDLSVKSNALIQRDMEVEAAEAEVRRLKEALAAAERELSSASSGGAAQLQSLERQLASAHQRVTELEAIVRQRDETIKSLGIEAKEAKDAAQRANALHAASAAELHEAQKEAAQLRSALVHANDNAKSLEAKLEAANRRAASAEQEAREAKEAAKRASGSQDAAQAKQAELDKQLAAVQKWQMEARTLHQESINTVKKVLTAEEACESSYSCHVCLEVMRDPVVCAPCGHAFCRPCLMKENKVSGGSRSVAYCPECDDDTVNSVLPSKNLEVLASRFEFRKRSLRDLAALLQRSFTGLGPTDAA